MNRNTMNCNTPPGQPSGGGQALVNGGSSGFSFQWTQEPTTEMEFLVGIDFGTTSSGVTIMASGSNLKSGGFTPVKVALSMGAKEVDKWIFGSKIPTRISFSDRFYWGHYAHDEPFFEWFKLAVAHDDELQKDLSNVAMLAEAQALRHQRDVTVSDLVKVYLKELWDHCVYSISLAKKMSSEKVRQSKFYVVIGAPANWRAGTLTFLLTTAREAGIPGKNNQSHVETCTEPEAAAIALLLYDQNIMRILTNGDIFTVLDAGGGTSDAITFKMQQSKPILLERCVTADARFCGPVQVEKLLLDCFTQKIQDVANAHGVATLTAAEIRPLFHHLWRRTIAHNFNGSNGNWMVRIPIPTNQHGTAVGFTQHELKTIMEPTMTKITDLIDAQFKKASSNEGKLPKALIVCGGFSQNLYVQEKVRERIREWGEHIQVHFAAPQLNMKAVSKGCVVRAMELRRQYTDNKSDVPTQHAQHTYEIEGRVMTRSVITPGRILPMDKPKLITLYPHDFKVSGPPHFLEKMASVTILEEKMSFCVLEWRGASLGRLYAAFQNKRPVMLGVRQFMDVVHFTAHVDGEEVTENGFCLDVTMNDVPVKIHG